MFLNQGTETFVNIITQPIATTEAKTLSFEKFHFIDEETSTDDVWIILFQRPRRKAKQSFPANFSKILYSHTCKRLSLTCLPLRWNPRLRHQPLIIYNQKLWQIRPHKVVRLLEMHYTKAFKVEPLAPWLWLFRYFNSNHFHISISKKVQGEKESNLNFSRKWKCLIFSSISWPILIKFFLFVRLHYVGFKTCLISFLY